MRKFLNILLVPIISLLFLFASTTLIKADDCSITSAPSRVDPGNPIQVVIEGSPNTSYSAVLVLDGTSVDLGNAETDDDGHGTITITAPATEEDYELGVYHTSDIGHECGSQTIQVSGNPSSTVDLGEDGPARIGDIVEVLRKIIGLLVPIAAIAFLLMLIWGGFQFMMSGGDPKAAGAARTTLTFAVIGLILVVVSWLLLLLIKYITGVDVTTVIIPTLE